MHFDNILTVSSFHLHKNSLPDSVRPNFQSGVNFQIISLNVIGRVVENLPTKLSQ